MKITEPDALWNALERVRALSFVAESDTRTGWCGAGAGLVAVSGTADTLVFAETGTWRTVAGAELGFRNTYRWTRLAHSLRLDHLRFGESEPVYLFDLAAHGNGVWESVTAHQCRDDEYAARLHHENGIIHLLWTVSGANKSERIAYVYS
ncbi:MAG: hypothetical protein H7Y38_17580 [Armatimonadetes bacterium]|nr:hypothetical protein [Armatimonadota bacterium]